jgi:hypothetical protein
MDSISMSDRFLSAAAASNLNSGLQSLCFDRVGGLFLLTMRFARA